MRSKLPLIIVGIILFGTIVYEEYFLDVHTNLTEALTIAEVVALTLLAYLYGKPEE